MVSMGYWRLQNQNSRVDRAEVTLHATNLLLKELMPEARLKLALPEGRRRDAHGILTTAEQNIRLVRGDGSAVQWRLRHVRLQNCQSLGFM